MKQCVTVENSEHDFPTNGGNKNEVQEMLCRHNELSEKDVEKDILMSSS